MSRVMQLLNAMDARIKSAESADGRACFADTRLHLDPYTLDDLLRESVRPPAARITFVDGKPQKIASGGINLFCRLAIIVITKREGRHDGRVSSADVAAIELALAAAALVEDDPYFGIGRMHAAQVDGVRIAISERDEKNKSGVAIAAVTLSTTLLDVTPERPLIARAAETGRNPWMPVGLEINGESIPAEDIGLQPDAPVDETPSGDEGSDGQG